MALGMSAFRAVFWATCLAVALSFLGAKRVVGRGACCGRSRPAAKGVLAVARHHGDRRHHRRRRHADRAGAEDRRHHRRRSPAGQLLPDRDLLGDRGLAARAGGAGDGLVHHRRGHGRAGADAGRRAPTSPRTCSSSITRCSRRSARRPRCRRSPPPRSPAANPFRTMMLTWKYTLPAFLVPFVFTLSSDGLGLLLQASAPVVAVTSADRRRRGRRAGARPRAAGSPGGPTPASVSAPRWPDCSCSILEAASICSASACWRQPSPFTAGG